MFQSLLHFLPFALFLPRLLFITRPPAPSFVSTVKVLSVVPTLAARLRKLTHMWNNGLNFPYDDLALQAHLRRLASTGFLTSTVLDDVCRSYAGSIVSYSRDREVYDHCIT